MYIAIAGNIGSGKTTLTGLLARRYGWHPHYEVAMENPYIEDYYRDIQRWAFCMEIFYLRHRFADLLRIAASKETVVQDRTLWEGAYVFATNNHRQGNLSDRDYETYMSLFETMMEMAEQPALMVYLRASVPHLVANIQRRGRTFEQNIPIDYLRGLNDLYEVFAARMKAQIGGRFLTIEVDDLDFLHRPGDLEQVTDKIDSQLFGLFPAIKNPNPPLCT